MRFKNTFQFFSVLGCLLAGLSAQAQNNLNFFASWGNEGETVVFPITYEVDGLPPGSALQFDLTWNTVELRDVTPLEKDLPTDHTLDFSYTANDSLRVLLFSIGNEDVPITGIIDIEAMLFMDLSTDSQPLTVTNILLSDSSGGSISIEDVSIIFNIPKNLSTEFGTNRDTVVANWDTLEGADNFEIWRSPDQTFENAQMLETQADNTYEDASIELPKIYYYWLIAAYPNGMSSPSQISRFSPFPKPVSAFSIEDGTHPDDTALNWLVEETGVESVAFYRATHLDVASAELIGTADATATEYMDTTAWAGLSYNYWVVATNEFGAGDPTDALSGLSAFPLGTEFPSLKLAHTQEMTEVSWNSTLGDTYLMLFSSDMQNWHIFPEELTGTGELIQWAYDDPDSLGYPIFFKLNQVKE